MGIHKEFILSGLYLHTTVSGDYDIWKEKMLEIYGDKASRHLIDVRRWVLGSIEKEGPIFYRQPNCWEFMGCGNGEDAHCPARSHKRIHGLHGGINGGRACWLVPGTRCGKSVQTTMEQKQEVCSECDFLLAVKQEEGDCFWDPGSVKS